MADIVERLRAEVDPDVNEPLDRLLDQAAEIERLRELLREVINSAWEMELEDRHTINSDVIGKVAMAVLAFSSTNGEGDAGMFAEVSVLTAGKRETP